MTSGRTDSGGEGPVLGVVVDRAGEPAQPGVVGGVTGLQVEDPVGAGEGPAPVDHLVGGGPEARQPVVGDDRLDEQVAVLEVELPLRLGEHPGLVGEDLVWQHSRPLLTVGLNARVPGPSPLRRSPNTDDTVSLLLRVRPTTGRQLSERQDATVSLQGTLDTLSLPELCELLSGTNKTGALHVRAESRPGCAVVRRRAGVRRRGRRPDRPAAARGRRRPPRAPPRRLLRAVPLHRGLVRVRARAAAVVAGRPDRRRHRPAGRDRPPHGRMARDHRRHPLGRGPAPARPRAAGRPAPSPSTPPSGGSSPASTAGAGSAPSSGCSTAASSPSARSSAAWCRPGWSRSTRPTSAAPAGEAADGLDAGGDRRRGRAAPVVEGGPGAVRAEADDRRR